MRFGHAEMIGHLGFRELDKQGRDQRARKEAFVMALFGGIAVIAPLFIIALIPGLKTSLITTSVATVLFAGFLAGWATDASGNNVLAATAAYAAVLVVFVGTSLAPSSS